MPHRLIKYGLSSEYPEERKFSERPDLKDSYDVVIIGAGGHGLAAAYYLARDHGIEDVAVLEKGYIGAGGTGRNTAIVRSNYLTPEGVAFYDGACVCSRISRRSLTSTSSTPSAATLPWPIAIRRCGPRAGGPR